jgi:hypothetical protein
VKVREEKKKLRRYRIIIKEGEKREGEERRRREKEKREGEERRRREYQDREESADVSRVSCVVRKHLCIDTS